MESLESAKLSADECFELEPISKWAAYIVLGLYVSFALLMAWRTYTLSRNAELGSDHYILVLVLIGLVGLFALYVADAYATTIWIDSNAIEKIGLFDRRVKIPWKTMKRIRLSPGADYKGIPANPTVLVAGKATLLHANRFEFSGRHTAYFKRKAFWDAARLIVALADMNGVEVKGRKNLF
jgi:hypothetical protein